MERRLRLSESQSSATVIPAALFETFIKNIGTLSKAERKVFDLYLKGKSAQRIAEELDLSINTIKTHNKRIYIKLDVTSREQLLVYIKMLRERSDYDI